MNTCQHVIGDALCGRRANQTCDLCRISVCYGHRVYWFSFRWCKPCSALAQTVAVQAVEEWLVSKGGIAP